MSEPFEGGRQESPHVRIRFTQEDARPLASPLTWGGEGKKGAGARVRGRYDRRPKSGFRRRYTCPRVGLRTVGACEPRQIRKEAALSIPFQVCGSPGPFVSCDAPPRGGAFLLESFRGRALPEIPPPDLRRGRRSGGGRPDAEERDHRRTGAPGLSLRRPARHRQDVDGADPREEPELHARPDGDSRTARATPASRSPPARRST